MKTEELKQPSDEPDQKPLVTLRPMTEQDLPMLHDWLNRPHIEWWGGEAQRPTLAQVRAEYLPSALAERRVTPYVEGLGTKLVIALVELLFRDPKVTRIQTDPAPTNLRAIRCYEKAGFRQVKTIVTPDGPAIYMLRERP